MLEELYRKYATGLWRYAKKIVGDPDQAADVVQDVFMKLLKKTDKLCNLSPSQTKAYLMVATKHTAWRLVHKRNRTLLLPSDIEEINPDVLPEQHVIRLSNREEMLSAIETLTPLQGDVIILRYYVDLSFKEIAEFLGIREDNARVLASRARAKLSHYFTHEDEQ